MFVSKHKSLQSFKKLKKNEDKQLKIKKSTFPFNSRTFLKWIIHCCNTVHAVPAVLGQIWYQFLSRSWTICNFLPRSIKVGLKFNCKGILINKTYRTSSTPAVSVVHRTVCLPAPYVPRCFESYFECSRLEKSFCHNKSPLLKRLQ